MTSHSGSAYVTIFGRGGKKLVSITLNKNDLIPNFSDLLTRNCYKCVVIFNIYNIQY